MPVSPDPAPSEEEPLPIDLDGPRWAAPDPRWVPGPPGPASEPPAIEAGGHRLDALDGMRALAVTAVIVYHATSNWAIGGYFGVDVFFALSGFLITTLLLREWRGTGGIALRRFWARRARRLLPALFVMLAVVGTVSVLFPRVLGSPGLLGDTLATLGYVANWHFVASHTSYFSTTANQSPLLHTWTLAIEEQFYLIWPLVVLALVGGFRRLRHPPAAGGHSRLVLVAGVALIGAAASALFMALLVPVGSSNVSRAYYGSDTRAQGLLIGAALAAICLWWGPIRTAIGRRLLGGIGVLGAVGIVAMWRMVPETSGFTFHGGFAVLALCAAGVIACVTHLTTHPLSRLLAARPLAYLGRISYGMYLWYWPVLLVMTPQRIHTTGVLLLTLRMGVIITIAAASFRFVESPVRSGRLAGWRPLVVVPTAALTIAALPLLVPSAAATVPPVESTAALPRVLVGGTAIPARPVRILLVGDSMAGSLGVGLSAEATRYGAEILNEGDPGCSLAEGSQVQVLWYTVAPGYPCQADNPAGLITAYRALVDQFDPDVVVYLARSDTLDTEIDGTWEHLGDPSFDFWAQARFDQAITALSARGAHVVLLTSPYYDSGDAADGSPWPENTPSRVTIDNQLLAAAARTNPSVASVYDLGSLLSPDGQYASSVDSVPTRCSDGVHITVPGGEWIGSQLLPKLVALGRPHADLAATATRPPLPALPQPWWYASLPCAT